MIKVTEISDTMFEVLGYTVKIQLRKGRKLLLCSCTNHTKFCTENAHCYHKELVTRYLALKPIKFKIEHLKREYEGFKGIGADITKEMYEDYLKQVFTLFDLK